MTKTYRATFEIPATITVELDVIADDQQQGLVLAHDKIMALKLNEALKITSISKDNASIVNFERVESAVIEQTSETHYLQIQYKNGNTECITLSTALSAAINEAVKLLLNQTDISKIFILNSAKKVVKAIS